LTGQATVWRAIAFLVLWLVLVGGVGSLWLGEAFPAYPAAYAKQLMAIELAALALISLLLRLFPWHTYLPFPAKTLINPPALETLWSVLWPILVGGTITMLIERLGAAISLHAQRRRCGGRPGPTRHLRVGRGSHRGRCRTSAMAGRGPRASGAGGHLRHRHADGSLTPTNAGFAIHRSACTIEVKPWQNARPYRAAGVIAAHMPWDRSAWYWQP
jgi:hypothetical protein